MALLLASTGKKQSVGLPREQQAEQGLILSHCRERQMVTKLLDARDGNDGGIMCKWKDRLLYLL